MLAGAEGLLQRLPFPLGEQRRPEVVPHIVAQGLFRLGEVSVCQAALDRLGVGTSALSGHQMLSVAEAEGPHGRQAVQRPATAEQKPGAVFAQGLCLLGLGLSGNKTEVVVEEIQCGLRELRPVQFPGKFQRVQQFPVLLRHSGVFAQSAAEVSLLQPGQQFPISDAGALVHHPTGIAAPQGGQSQTVGGFPLVDRVLQPKPYQLLVECLVPAAVEGGKEGINGLGTVVFPDGANDAVPVEIRPSLVIIGLEVRLKVIVPGGVPDQVPGPALLTVQNFHQANTSP